MSDDRTHPPTDIEASLRSANAEVRRLKREIWRPRVQHARRLRCQRCERVATVKIAGRRVREIPCPFCGARLRTFAWHQRDAQKRQTSE